MLICFANSVFVGFIGTRLSVLWVRPRQAVYGDGSVGCFPTWRHGEVKRDHGLTVFRQAVADSADILHYTAQDADDMTPFL